jgi:hypothetical protein
VNRISFSHASRESDDKMILYAKKNWYEMMIFNFIGMKSSFRPKNSAKNLKL